MKVITVNENNFGKWKGEIKLNAAEFKEFKKFALEKFGNKISGKNYWNDAIGRNIYVGKDELKHGLNVKGTIDKTKSLSVLDKLLSSALLKKETADKRIGGRSVYELTNLVKISGRIYAAKIIVKEDEKGRFYYHHDLLKIEKVS